MSRATLQLCDLCDTPLEGQMKGVIRKEKPYNGLTIEVGYSIGGWGRRQNHLQFSGEVCVPCYDRVMVAVRALQQALKECGEPEPPRVLSITK